MGSTVKEKELELKFEKLMKFNLDDELGKLNTQMNKLKDGKKI